MRVVNGFKEVFELEPRGEARIEFVRLLAAVIVLLLTSSILAAGEEAAISASPSLANPQDEIVVSYSGAPGFETDWIGIYKVGAANEDFGEWYYLEGETKGTLTFTTPEEEGDYEFRVFSNWAGGGGYSDIARSNWVSVDVSAAEGCNWDSFTPDDTAFVGQQGGVFPLRKSPFAAGSYLVLVGPAGEGGLDLPPESWKTFGPYELLSGHKYKASIESPLGGSLRFEEVSADLFSYGDPGPGYASVYARNNCPGDIWYAICLQLIEPAGEAEDEVAGDWRAPELLGLI